MVKADDIFLFVQVVEEGSFSRIAEKLEMTNSVVSKRISRLEKALNVQLLYRTTRKLTLTDAGRTLYRKGTLARQALQDAQDSVTGYGDIVRGKIKVTVPDVSAKLVINRAVAEFCLQHPDVEVELFVSNRVVNMLEDGFDLAIRTAKLEDSSFVARRLVDSHWIVCASPEYLKKYGTPDEPNALSNHHCLIYKYEGTGPDIWLFNQNGSSANVQVQGRLHANNLETLRQTAILNLGIAYLPKALVNDDINSGKLVEILGAFTSKDLGIYAVYPKSRQPDKKLTLLVEQFRDAFQAQKNRYS